MEVIHTLTVTEISVISQENWRSKSCWGSMNTENMLKKLRGLKNWGIWNAKIWFQKFQYFACSCYRQGAIKGKFLWSTNICIYTQIPERVLKLYKNSYGTWMGLLNVEKVDLRKGDLHKKNTSSTIPGWKLLR